MKFRYLIIVCIFLISSLNTKAGRINIDSIKREFKSPSKKKFNKLHDLIYELNGTNSDTAILLGRFYLEEAYGFGDKKIYASANFSLGSALFGRGDFKEAIRKFKVCLENSKKYSDFQLEIESLNSLGLVYLNMGTINLATETLFSALTKCKSYNNDPVTLAAIYQNLGLVYNSSGEIQKSIENMELALKETQKTGDSLEIIHAYFNLGGMHANNEEYVKGENYFVKAREIAKRLNDKKIEAGAVNNLAWIYYFNKSYKKANEYFEEALKLRKQIGDGIGLVETLNGIGTFYLSQNEFKKANYYCRKAFDEANRINYKLFNPRICDCISEANKLMGNFKEAYEFYRLSVLANDSLSNLEQQSKLAEEEQKMKYRVKTTKDSVLRVEEKKVEEARLAESEARLQYEKTQRYALGGGLLLVLGFTFFIINRLRVIRKQRDLITLKEEEAQQQRLKVLHQKEIVEEKNKEILDSITYAKRLQDAILPPLKLVKEYLPESFILYKPKDIIAGDFYFVEPIGDKIIFAAADCTGHGVPGAMVSVVCSNAMNRAVKEFGLIVPSEILEKVREIVLETFAKSESEVKDGMDISLCLLDLKHKKLEWAGANNPLWIFRKEKDGNISFIETKPDKQPIGKSTVEFPFTNHEVDLQREDFIYVFTDGFEDQFGGEKGKKFKSSNMKKMLIELYSLSADEQKIKINQAFENWKGDLEQVDDVCIIGIRI